MRAGKADCRAAGAGIPQQTDSYSIALCPHFKNASAKETKLMEENKVNAKFIFRIFLSFFKISPLSFGGGFAMIPIIEDEVVHKQKWVTKEQIVDIFAIIQSLPGAIAVNAASLVGYQIAGVFGAIAAFLGVILPTFAIMVVFGAMLITYQHNFFVQAALQGIPGSVVVAMIASAAYKMSKGTIVDKTCFAITIVKYSDTPHV